MDTKVSEKIKRSLEEYSNLLQEIRDMETALKKVDMDSFYSAHERMMNCLESLELSNFNEELDEEPSSTDL